MVVSEPLVHATLLGEALEHGPVAVFVFDEDLRYVAVAGASARGAGVASGVAATVIAAGVLR
jgi:hypothetical protein